MGFSKRYRKKLKGGAAVSQTGIDVNSIASFNPITMSGLVAQIAVSDDKLKRTPVGEYAAEQMPLIKIGLLDAYSANLSEPVITELSGFKHSLKRLEAIDAMSTAFPTLYESATGEPPGLDISADNQSIILTTIDTIELPDTYTILVGGEGVSAEYNTTLDRIFIKASSVGGTPTYTTDIHGKTVRVPTALFRELLVFDRELTKEERELLDGYLAYKGNTQYLLPANHPYMPDMSADAVLTVPIGQIDSVIPALKAAAQRLDTDRAAYTAKVGEDSTSAEYTKQLTRVKGAQQALEEIRQLLSKGVLLARAKVKRMDYTLDDIYALLNAAQLYSVPINAAEIDSQVKEAEAILKEAKDFLPRLADADQKLVAIKTASTANAIQEARADAETEERLHTVEAQSRRKEFVQARRQIRAEINRLGNTLLAPHIEAYSSELETTKDAFLFQEKQRLERLRTMEALLQPIRNSFSNQTIDISGSTSTLQTLETIFQAIDKASKENDIAYLNTQIERITKESLAILESWSNRRSFALFRRLYIAHLRQAFEKTETLLQFLNKRIDTVEEAARQLLTDMATLRRIGDIAPYKPEFPTDSFLPLEPIYMAKLSDADAAILCGYSYIRTDKSGVPISEMNAAGDADVQFMFPEYMDNLSINPSASGKAYTYASGYENDASLQSLFVVPIQKESIMNRLPPSRIPILRSIKLEGLSKPSYEIPRDYVNSILQITGEGAQWPISLPRYAVRSEAFYCIQNIGKDPICIRNPGALEDSVEMIGPSEVRVYMYGEGTSLSSIPGFAYGSLPWQEGLLPYDTLLRNPRTSTAVYVTDLKTIIYCSVGAKEKRIATLDSEGYFIPVIPAADGNIYDLDDYALSCPYKIQILSECSLQDLIYDRETAKGQVKSVKGITIPTMKDSYTGTVLFCSREGVPAVDEFGVCKMASIPLLWAEGSIKCKGSVDDIHITPSRSPSTQPYLYPEGLTFSQLFRSHFCKESVFVNGQGIPLVGPSGTYLSLPPNAVQKEPGLYIYEEPRGQMNQSFTVDSTPPLPSRDEPAEFIPFKSFEDMVASLYTSEKAKRTLYRFIGGFEYAKGTPKRLRDAAIRIQSLGDTITESIRSNIEETAVMVEERLKTFAELEETIGRIQRVITTNTTNTVPTDIVMTLGVLELKLRDKMLEIMKIIETVEKPIENYEFLLERRAAAMQFVERMRQSGESTFKNGYRAIQDLYKLYIENTKSISSPELDATTVQLKEKEMRFLDAQVKLEVSLREQPDTVSEIREWLLNLQQGASKQFTDLQAAQTLVIQQVIVKIGVAEKNTRQTANSELETLRARLDAIRQDVKRYAELYEMRSTPSEIQTPEKATQEKGPFVHLVSPSIEGDIIPLLGREAVSPILAQASKVATLWSTIRSKVVLPLAESTSLTALKMAVESGHDAVNESQDACNQIKLSMAVPFEVYKNAAFTKLETLKAGLQASIKTLRAYAMDLDSQRMAITTTAQSLEGVLSDEELVKLKGLRDSTDEIAKRLTLEMIQPEILRIQPVLEGIQTNPFVAETLRNNLEGVVKQGADAIQAMRDRVNTFREFCKELIDRLVAVLDEQRRTLQQEYSAAQKSGDFTSIQNVSADIPSLLTAIGEVGRLRSELVSTS